MGKKLYVGSYTDGDDGASLGVYAFEFDPAAGELRKCGAGVGVPNPSFVAMGLEADAAPTEGSAGQAADVWRSETGATRVAAREAPAVRRLVYAACEVAEQAMVGAFDAATLELVDLVAIDGGAGTCHVLEHPRSLAVYGADYASGSVCGCALNADKTFGRAFPVVRQTGFGLNSVRQEGSHVHTLSFVPGTEVLAAVDLGSDIVSLYELEEDGALRPSAAEVVRLPVGFGPRMVAYHPRLPIAAVVGELACEVDFFRFDADGFGWAPCSGRVRLVDSKIGAPTAAHVAYSPDGRFLYATVRGADVLVALELDEKGHVVRKRRQPCGGAGPRHFSLSPHGVWLAVANLASGTVDVFKRNVRDGSVKLQATTKVLRPSCAVWA